MAFPKRSEAAVVKIRKFALDGLPDTEIAPKVGLSAALVGTLRRDHNIPSGCPPRGRLPMDPAEAAAKREELRQIHLSGPAMGVCRHCWVWHPLDGVRVRPHPFGERQCPGSHHRPVPHREDL